MTKVMLITALMLAACSDRQQRAMDVGQCHTLMVECLNAWNGRPFDECLANLRKLGECEQLAYDDGGVR